MPKIERKERYQAMLPPSLAKKITKLGGGNFSAGVREMAKLVFGNGLQDEKKDEQTP